MNKERKTPPDKAPPPESWWVFKDCKATELSTCLSYEYARESASMKLATEAVRAFLASNHPINKAGQRIKGELEKGEFASATRLLDRPTGKELARVIQYEKLRALAQLWFVDVKGFPDTPWLELSQQQRSDAQRQHESETGFNMDLHIGALADSVIAANPADNWSAWCTARNPNVSGWFSIPCAKFTKEDVLEAFELALDDLSTATPNLLLRFGSRGGPADQLRQLGALRLMKDRPASKAMRIFYLQRDSEPPKVPGTLIAPKGKEYLYTTIPDIWYNARKAALRQIKEIDAEAERLRQLLEETKNFK